MISGRRVTWLVFAVCTLLVVDGFGWVTWQMVSLERREREASRRAAVQEATRLALWRMDGLLNPIIAAEAARPYFQYRAFYPAERPYSRMWEPAREGEALAPSPLLAGPDRFIRLHFEGTADGWLTSPQVPEEAERHRVQEAEVSISSVLDAERELLELTNIVRGSPRTALPDAAAPTDAREIPRPDDRLARRREELQTFAQEQRDRSFLEADAAEVGEIPMPQAASDPSVQEYAARQQAAEIARNRGDLNVNRRRAGEDVGLASKMSDEEPAALILEEGLAFEDVESPPTVRTGPFTPVWLRNPLDGSPELLFIRAVRVESTETLQGFWVDWEALRGTLLATSRDLLPGASLQPVMSGPESSMRPVADVAADAGRLLAGIPAVLSPGPVALTSGAGITPTRTVLVVAWLAVVAAIVAIGFVLKASLALSDRRGRFVSAVTHELRTPLTTFCLYSQMLDDGLVMDETKRGEYLRVLRQESERLAGIVENVLAFARIGKGAKAVSHAGVRVAEIVGSIVPTLRERAQREGMTLVLEIEGSEEATIAADRGSVERILGNLVENACRYAAGADDPRIIVTMKVLHGELEASVRDFGPGVSRRDRRRIFTPFARTRVAEERAAAGLGLGLSLSRSVARSLGGELSLGPARGQGAEFVLVLPLANDLAREHRSAPP